MNDFVRVNQQLDFIDSGRASSVTSPGSFVMLNGEVNNAANSRVLSEDNRCFTTLQLEHHLQVTPSKESFLQRPGAALLRERNKLTARRNNDAFDHAELLSDSEELSSAVESEDGDYYRGGCGEVNETGTDELSNGWWQPIERRRLARRIRYERLTPTIEMENLNMFLPSNQRRIYQNNRAFDGVVNLEDDSYDSEDSLSSEEELERAGSLHAHLYGDNSMSVGRLSEGGAGFNSRQFVDELEEQHEENERAYFTKHAAGQGQTEGLVFNSASPWTIASGNGGKCPDRYSEMFGIYGRGTYEPENPWVLNDTLQQQQQQQSRTVKTADDHLVYPYYLERSLPMNVHESKATSLKCNGTSTGGKHKPLGTPNIKEKEMGSEGVANNNSQEDSSKRKKKKKKVHGESHCF